MSETLANMEKIGGIDYSTDEQWTGRRWIDGKKVYQKVFNNISVSSGNTVIPNSVISNLDNVISITGMITDGSNPRTIPFVFTDATGWNIAAGYVANTGFRLQAGASIANNATAFVIVRYTKTTS